MRAMPFLGKAVEMLAKKTDTILVGFKEAKDRLIHAKNVVVTGTPTKIKDRNFNSQEKAKILKDLGLKENKPMVLIFGGSQGAKAINETIIEIVNNKLNKAYQIMWAPGPMQFKLIKQKIKNMAKLEGVQIVPYIYNMEEVMNVADLIIARSGAMTITEVATVGKPAIFVPLPYVSQNHQEYNAKVLEKVGAAKIILNKDLKPELLNEEIEEIIKHPDKIKQMSKQAKQIAMQQVEDKIYEEIKKLCQSK